MQALWRVAAFPLLLVLALLEPLITFVFAALSLLGLLTTLFFYFFGRPGFPLLTMLAISLGFALILVPYHALVRWLSAQ